jgi:hypothetical protein
VKHALCVSPESINDKDIFAQENKMN